VVPKPAPPKPAPPSQPPRTPDPARLAEALAHVDAGRLDEAIEILEAAYREAPSDAQTMRLLCDAYNRRAIARYSADRLEAALADLGRSLDINPDQPDIRMQRNLARERLQRLNAIDDAPPSPHEP